MNNNKINKSLFPKFSLAVMILASASFSNTSFANDISHKLRDSTGEKATTENHFELGLGLAIGRAPSLTDDEINGPEAV